MPPSPRSLVKPQQQIAGHHHPVTSKQKPLPHRTLKAIRQVVPPLATPTKTVLTTHPIHHATLSASALIGIFLGSLSGLVLLLWGLSFLAARRRRHLLSQQVKTSTSDTQPTAYYRGPDGDIFIHSLKSSGPPLSPTLTSASDATLTAAAARLGRSGSRRCRSHSHSHSRSRSRSHSRHRHGHCPKRPPHYPGHGGHDHDHSHEHGHWHWHDHHDHHCLPHMQDTTSDQFEIPPVPEIPAIPNKSTNRPRRTPSSKTKEDYYTTVTVTEIPPITLGPDSAPPLLPFESPPVPGFRTSRRGTFHPFSRTRVFK